MAKTKETAKEGKTSRLSKEQIDVLGRIGKIVGSLQQFEDTLNHVVTLIIELVGVDVCSLFLVDPERKDLVLRATEGLSKKAVGRLRVNFGEGIIGWAAQERSHLYVPDVKKDPRLQHIPGVEASKTISSLIVPLTMPDKVLGVLDLQSFSYRKFSEKETESVCQLAKELSVLIKGAELFDETKKNLLEHQVLYRIGLLLTSAEKIDEVLNVIVQSVVRIVGTPAGSLALYDEENEEFYLAVSVGFSPEFSSVSKWKLRLGGLTSTIVSKRAPLVIPDVSLDPTFDNPVMLKEGIKSLVAVPLIAESKIVGVLYVDDFVPRDFTSTEVSILSLLANQATIAIIKAQLLEQTKQLAITDGLTDVFNHRYFQERLDEEIKRAERYNHPLSLMVLDIDHFKKYNDTYGHPKGDIVLRAVARIIGEITREVDIVCRYGGEEFVVILPETEKKDALQVAEKIRKSVEEHSFPSEKDQPGGRITVSIGTATYPYDGVLKEEFIGRTDKALYAAKEAGRNRVCTPEHISKG